MALLNTGGLDHVGRAQLPRRLDLAVVLDDGDDLAAGKARDVKNHQPQRAAANDGHSVAGMRSGIFKAVDRAGQRLGQSRVFQGDVVGNVEGILGYDASRNADEFGISAVVEEQIVAEVFLAARAEVALAAGCGIERDDAAAVREAANSLACLDDGACEFVAKEGGRDDHAGMVAAAKDFQSVPQVRAAPTRTISSPGAARGTGTSSIRMSWRPCRTAAWNRRLAQPARRLECIAANLNDLFHCAPAHMEDFLDRVTADLEHIPDGTFADLENILDCRTAGFHRVWHYFAPVPETGSIIIFIESALGCEAAYIDCRNSLP